MFCPKCGSKIPNNSKFCTVCGEKITDAANENQNPQTETEETDTTVNVAAPGAVQPKKKTDNKKIIGIAVAAVIVIVAIFGLKSIFSGSGSDDAYVYLSDGKYELITNLSKNQIIEIASSKSDYTFDYLLSFSPDGKYIYYFTKYDSYSDTGTLCRAEYGKLKKDSDKNDKYIEIIATNVSAGFRFLDNGYVTYKNGDNTLYYFDGEDTVQIAKSVNYYFTYGSEKIVYATGDYGDYRLYGVELSDIDNKIKLASDCAYVYDRSDFDNILYTKYEDDGSETLYVVGFGKESEKLAENVCVFTQLDKVYFTSDNGTTLSLYDFVEDEYAESDAEVTEPDIDDYTSPAYSYEMVYGYNLSESDFDELYTSCTKNLSFGSFWGISMVDALEETWGENTDEIHAAIQSFIDKYADTADELGYIRVTDEVKAALQEIAQYADEPEESTWLYLCYNKYQSGTYTDYESYNEAYEEWYEVSDRVYMRETLKDEENDYKVKTLYCYDNGKVTTVNENVLNTSYYTGAILFNTTDMITDTVDIEDVYSTYDVRDLLYIDYEAENYILLSDGTICRMSSEAAETFSEAYDADYAMLYFTTKGIYMSESNGALSAATVKSGVVGDFELIADDAEILETDDTTIYYASDVYQNNYISYGDLYSYSNGTGTRLARDIMVEDINLYGDGVILAYTGYRSSSGYELTMIDSKGEATIIADNVTQYIRVDKSTLLYISDDDLYCYDGKTRTMVASDVDYVWSLESMEIENTLGWYDYDYDYYYYG
jgi:hypothetical protein